MRKLSYLVLFLVHISKRKEKGTEIVEITTR